MNSKFTKLLLINILCLCSFIGLQGQEATISGNILDTKDNSPLIGATLKVGTAGVVTDVNGDYKISISPGKHTLQASYLGYEDYKKVIEVKAGENLNLPIQLEETNTILNTVTVSSGKYEKPLSEVTVSMEILKPRLLQAENTTSVDEVLGKLPGVNIISGQPNIRGGSGWSYGAGSRVLLLVDDIPALQADAGFPNWDDIPVESIEQIEVIKGASSALYGSSALNGIINVRTAYAKSKPETQLSTFYGINMKPKDKSRVWWDSPPYSFGLSGVHKRKIGKLDLVVGGFFLDRTSSNQFSERTYGRLNVNTRYRITDRLTVGINGNFNKTKGSNFFYWKDSESGAYQPDTTTLSSSEAFRYYIDPHLTYYDKSGNRHKLTARYTGIANDNSDNQSNSSDLWYTEYQFQRKIDQHDLVITSGLVGIFSAVKSELYGDTAYTTTNLAGYLQMDKKFFDKLNISIGTRYEQVNLEGPNRVIVERDTFPGSEDFGSKLVFRFGANYQAGPGTFIRTSFGQGYRYPTLAEKYVATSAGAIRVFPSPDLDSETGWSTEIGVKQAFQLSGWKGYFDVAAFWTEYQNMMEFTFSGSLLGFQSRNIGDTRIRGIDMTLAGQGDLWGHKTFLLAGYTYIDPTFKKFTDADRLSSSVDYNILKYRYKHTFKSDLEVHFGKVVTAITASYFSHMEAVDAVLEIFLPGVMQFREENNTGYTLLGARLGYQFNDHAKLMLIGKNLSNQVYSQRPGLLLPPRNFTLRLDVNF